MFRPNSRKLLLVQQSHSPQTEWRRTGLFNSKRLDNLVMGHQSFFDEQVFNGFGVFGELRFSRKNVRGFQPNNRSPKKFMAEKHVRGPKRTRKVDNIPHDYPWN